MINIILLWLTLQSSFGDDSKNRRSGICVKSNSLSTNCPIATDTDDFFEFVNKSDIYIDSSLLIKQILDTKNPLVQITYPPKWGKTIALSMLKFFFELYTTSSESYLASTPSYKYFTTGEISLDSGSTQKLKTPPLISTHEDIIKNYLGQYPVLHLDLSNCKGETFDRLLDTIKEAFVKTSSDHYYLKDAIAADDDGAKIMSYLLTDSTFDDNVLSEGLLFLSEMLHEYHQKKSFVFIDGYDTIIKELYFGSATHFETKDKKRLVKFFIKLLRKSFIENEFLQKGVITGVLEVLQRRSYNRSKNIEKFNLFNPSDFFGFNEHQVREIFQQVNLPVELTQQSIRWFGGYKMGQSEQFFNPSSIARFLKTKQLENFTGEFPPNKLRNLFAKNNHIVDTFKSLIQGTKKTISICDFDFNEQQLSRLSHVFNQIESFEETDEKAYTLLLSYFCAVGFLTFDDVTIIKSNRQLSLKIPNEQLSTYIRSYIRVDEIPSNSTTTVVTPAYEDYEDPTDIIILEKDAMRISHKPREYKLI